MSNSGLQKFSEELKKHREEKEISIQQIASKTKIDLKFIKAIEDCNFEIMPDVYMRAFIREYANTIGLDGYAALEKYDRYKAGYVEEAEAVDAEETQPEKTEKKTYEPVREFDATVHSVSNDDKKAGLSRAQVISYSAAGILIIALIVSYFMFFRNSSPDFITERQENVSEQVNDAGSGERFSGKQETNESADGTAVPAGMIKVKITAEDTAWVRVLIDDKDTEEFTLYPANAKEITAADNMKFLLGNSGGIKFWLNGKALNYQGRKGVVQNVKIDNAGLTVIK